MVRRWHRRRSPRRCPGRTTRPRPPRKHRADWCRGTPSSRQPRRTPAGKAVWLIRCRSGVNPHSIKRFSLLPGLQYLLVIPALAVQHSTKGWSKEVVSWMGRTRRVWSQTPSACSGTHHPLRPFIESSQSAFSLKTSLLECSPEGHPVPGGRPTLNAPPFCAALSSVHVRPLR